MRQRVARSMCPAPMRPLALGALFCVLPALSQAVEFSHSGFATVAVGRVLSGDSQKKLPNGTQCPCYVTDYAGAGVYDSDWSFNPDSRIGLQGVAQFDPKTSLTAQVLSTGAKNFKGQVDWLYLSRDLTDTLTVQVGRKRLPLYQYSDFAQVGYAYPWIRPPADLYGWQIVAYNGANLLYRATLGDVAVRANAWVGRERDKRNRMLDQLYNGTQVEETWKKIGGAYVDFNFDNYSIRATFMRNTVDRWETVRSTGVRSNTKPNVKQQFFGLAFNADLDNNVVVRSEINRFVRPKVPDSTYGSVKDTYSAALFGVGYRFDNVLPMLTYSKFKETYQNYPSYNERHHTVTASVRWDFQPNMALKVQYDHFTDDSGNEVAAPYELPKFTGNAKAIAVALDIVF